MENFIAAFQCDFSQSLHLALYLRYAEPSARRQIKDAITTAILGVCNSHFRTVSDQSAHRLIPRAPENAKRANALRFSAIATRIFRRGEGRSREVLRSVSMNLRSIFSLFSSDLAIDLGT